MPDRGRSFSSIISDKRSSVFKRLKDSPPTIVLSREEGLYLFSPKTGKIKSTIFLGGTGQNFSLVEEWFRKQVAELDLAYAPNVAKAEAEVDLLPRVFQANTEAVKSVVYADLVLVEVQNDVEDDDIFRVDFQGDITRFDGDEPVVVSYNDPISEESEGFEHGRPEEDREEVVTKDLEKLGFSSVDELREDGAVDKLLEVYPGEAVFLDREKRRDEQWQWISEPLT